MESFKQERRRLTAVISKRRVYRPIGPSSAGIVPTFAGEYKIDYTDGSGAETDTFTCTVSGSIAQWLDVPDVLFTVYPQTARTDITSTGSEESIVWSGGWLDIDSVASETFEDIDWVRAQISITDWRSLNSLTFVGVPDYKVVCEVEVNSKTFKAVVGGQGNLQWSKDYGELSNLASDPSTDVLYLRVYFKDEAGAGTYPFDYAASGTDAYLLDPTPINIQLDFYNEFETIEGAMFTGGAGALTAVGLSELTAASIGKMFKEDGIVAQTAPALVAFAAPIGFAIGYMALKKWITSIDDFQAIISNLPAIAGAVLLGGGGSLASSMIQKYTNVSGMIAKGIDAASKAAMTLVLLSGLAVIGFEVRPAGNVDS
jgi:hypothetical protein